MEKYYTFLCETYSGDKVEITVKALSEKAAKNRLSDYKVNKGDLHYICKLINISESGMEKYYKSNNNSLALAIGILGAALGIAQTTCYFKGDKRKITDCLTGETIKLIKEV